MAKIGLYYKIIVRDKHGKIKRQTRRRKANSCVLGFLAMVEGAITHQFQVQTVVNSVCKDINNVTTGFGMSAGAASYSLFALFAADNNDAYGIVAGTGTTPVTNSDYKLETKIAHGTGSGQLDYGAHSVVNAQVVGSNVDLVLSRTLYNGSGATVTIKEIGMYIYGYTPVTGAATVCIVRDVVSDTPVANGETATVQYTVETTA